MVGRGVEVGRHIGDTIAHKEGERDALARADMCAAEVRGFVGNASPLNLIDLSGIKYHGDSRASGMTGAGVAGEEDVDDGTVANGQHAELGIGIGCGAGKGISIDDIIAAKRLRGEERCGIYCGVGAAMVVGLHLDGIVRGDVDAVIGGDAGTRTPRYVGG